MQTGFGHPRLIACGLLATLFAASPSSAQTPPNEQEDTGLRSVPLHVLKDEYKFWTSPLRRGSYSAHTFQFLVPFLAISGALLATDRRIAETLPNTSDQTRWSGRVSQAGASYSMAGIAATTYLVGRITGNERAKKTGLLSMEAFGHAHIATFAIKQITNRGRPVDGNGHGGFWRGGNSFPSGHSASAFAVAAVFASEYREHPMVAITSYSAAALIAASRSGARRHWMSDIFVGSSAGFFLGRFIHRRHLPATAAGNTIQRKWVPNIGVAGSGFGVGWHW
ncbi:MAG: phosphatase PAP2 family protein [Acidobacteria bacterium]|nr:phosphatase PAP2 family protein [Acidobacteriota bacterium]